MTSLSSLLAAAAAPSAMLDARLEKAAGKKWTGQAYTSDLNAAAALVDETLPGAIWSLRARAGEESVASVLTSVSGVRIHSSSGTTPALALLAAAMLAQENLAEHEL